MKCDDARISGQSRWRLKLVLIAASSACLVAACGTAYGPGSGTLTGIIRACTPGDIPGAAPDTAWVVTVYAQNQAGRTVATRRLTRKDGQVVRYRMSLPAGPYTINAVSESASAGVAVTVTADQNSTSDFTGAGGCV